MAMEMLGTTTLLLLAALSFLGALVWLTGASGTLEVSGGQVAAVGAVATLLVLYRMVNRVTTRSSKNAGGH